MTTPIEAFRRDKWCSPEHFVVLNDAIRELEIDVAKERSLAEQATSRARKAEAKVEELKKDRFGNLSLRGERDHLQAELKAKIEDYDELDGQLHSALAEVEQLKAAMCKERLRIESDERYHYEPAAVQINAPLALIQCMMEGQIALLNRLEGGGRDSGEVRRTTASVPGRTDGAGSTPAAANPAARKRKTGNGWIEPKDEEGRFHTPSEERDDWERKERDCGD